MAYKIIIDPGHGGSDSGATYNADRKKMMPLEWQWL